MIWGRLGWVISGLGWVVFWVLSNTFVLDISNISTISIPNIVGYDLSTAIGKIDTVFATCGVSITVFVGLEVSFCVIVMYSIPVFVDSWSIISWFLAVGWSMMSWSVISWSVYNWLVDNWGYIWSWFVDDWGYIWSWLVNWGWVVDWGMVNWGGVVNWGSVINWGWVSICWSMYRYMGWSMDSSAVLF